MEKLSEIPLEHLEAGIWRSKWRFYRVVLSAVERERIGAACRAYRRRWGLSQEDMAIEIGTTPQMIGPVERGGPFASLRLLALVDRLALDTRPSRIDAKALARIDRKEAERARDRAHRAWIDAGRPDSGPIKDATDAAWAVAGIPGGGTPAPRQERQEGKTVDLDPDIPFT